MFRLRRRVAGGGGGVGRMVGVGCWVGLARRQAAENGSGQVGEEAKSGRQAVAG